MRVFRTVLICLAVVAFTTSIAAAQQYWIKVTPTSVRGFVVEAQVETNIPGSMVLNVRLIYKGKADEGEDVGTAYLRVPLSNNKTKVTIDGQKKALPHGSTLPDGQYDIEVIFPRLWPRNTSAALATGLKTNLKGVATVELSGSEHSSVENNSADGARWVMENVYPGYYWNPTFWQNKFGEMVELEYRGTGDADILRVYYVKSINMSLLIDTRRNLIVRYSIGLSHE